jgi:hypothetical protein
MKNLIEALHGLLLIMFFWGPSDIFSEVGFMKTAIAHGSQRITTTHL